MQKFTSFFIFILILIFLAGTSCKQRGGSTGDDASTEKLIKQPFDSTLVAPFLKSYPGLIKYETDLFTVYRKSGFNYIWINENGITEPGKSLYDRFKHLEEEGISASFPYPEKIKSIFNSKPGNLPDNKVAELLLSSLYLFYAENVYKGIETDSITAMGWFVPLKSFSYLGLLDSVRADPGFPDNDNAILFSQYYMLRDALKRYRAIEKNGGWIAIEPDENLKAYKPNDTAGAIRQIRDRLFASGDIVQNNKSNRYDPGLVAAVKNFKMHNGFKPDSLIKPEHIRAMNIPVGERIKTIILNMERCRWISPGSLHEKEFIFVNIPAYKINLTRDGTAVFDSPVVVGSTKTKTVIFKDTMTYLIFSPFWNLPTSIYEKEIKPGIAADSNYLAKHNMEWKGGQLRQKPGRSNSLGLVKFIFPNPYDIYFHDTPSKSHFRRENRALSHGCVRVGKPREFALTILKDNKTWTPQKIDVAMNGGKETICSLPDKIPVYILYFTAWVDETGEVNFFKDVYDMDERLAKLLIYNGN